ncbi:MAG: ribosome small subunit-dependent GTPase A [Chlamydiae bacterium]|nr:ribosome small subunit-dependent GTPase A [Chlamydiota bacterium]
MDKEIDPFLYEEEIYLRNKKGRKQEKKLTTKKDISKFKKTDLGKEKKENVSKENLIRGRVLAILGEEIKVSSDEHEFLCTLRGFLKKEKTQNRNIIAVGDFVLFYLLSKNHGVISSIEDRFSILSREEVLGAKQHIIAVNIDQVLITSSVVMPPLKPPLIDRYIIATQKGNMRPIIVINKIDLLKDHPEEKKEYLQFLKDYENIGIQIISVSTTTKVGIEELHRVMKNKSSVFSGQSGVGKSSLINAITGKNLKTGDVVSKTYKGSHVTTTAQLIPLEQGGFCIDTPGIKSFGVWQLKTEEIASFYPEVK